MSRRKAKFQFDATVDPDTVVDNWVSRTSKRKKGRGLVNARRDLAEELSLLKPERWALVEPLLADHIIEEIEVLRRLKPSGARDRQIAHLGHLLHKEDTLPVRQILDGYVAEDHAPKSVDREAEDWRRRLFEDGDGALTAFVERFPEVDVPTLRMHLRQAGTKTEKKAKRARTMVYRMVRALLDPAADEGPDDAEAEDERGE